MEKYKFLKNIGYGSYGTVSKAIVKGTREVVAVKKLKKTYSSWDECSEIAEIVILRRLHHNNLIQLREVIRENEDLYLIFDYMDSTLIEFLQKNPSSHPLIVSYLRQAFEGLAYIHKSGYMHRDIKPENILVLESQCKISDFGLAKRVGCPKYTDYISTRWYRAPELLLHANMYTPAVDIWAMGCIIAEVYMGTAIFPGTNEKDQLERITSTLGSPSSWDDGKVLARRSGFVFKNCSGVMFNEFINAPRQALRIIELLLRWDPNQRITAVQALAHPFLVDGSEKKKLQIYPEQSRSMERMRNNKRNFK